MSPRLQVHVDPRAATPIYDQVVTQVKHAVGSGALASGDALPSVRQLAGTLRVNPNTIARAYRELEADGVVETRRGQGTYVAESSARQSPAARRRTAAPAVERAVAEARALGLSRADLDTLVDQAWTRLGGDPEKTA